MDTVYGEIHAGGKVHKNVSLTLNLNANGLAGTAGIEDAIIGFDFADQFHIWVGQQLVPVDRPNYGGPFFMITWNYPGFLTAGNAQGVTKTLVTAPAEGPSGRNAGVTIWGDLANNKAHYFLGGFQSGDLSKSPLLSGRLNFDLVGEESGYFGNETYFGDKDIVAIAVGGQFKKNGSAQGDDYSEINTDALVELKYAGGGWFTLDGGYYAFGGDHNPAKEAFYILGAIASPVVGVGNIQPMVRYQYGLPGNGAPKAWALDAFLTYLIKGPALRVTGGLQHTELGGGYVSNALQLGVQAIFF
jgi:hypothetical protein